MKKKILSVLKYLIFLTIGIVLFWLAVKDQNINEILAYFKEADYTWIIFSVIFMIASHVIRALRWNLLLGSLNYTTKTITTFYAVMIGYFVNLAVPRLGEITRCGVLAKHNKLPLNSVIGTVIVERAFDMITLVVIILITFFSQIYFLRDFLLKHVVNPVVSKFSSGTSALIVILGTVILFVLVIVVLYKVFLPRIKKLSFYYKIKRLIVGFINGIKSIKYIKQKKIFLLYTFFIWLMYFMTVYICFFALEATSGLTMINALTILVIGGIAVVTPTPGGIGAYQFLVITAIVSLFSLEPAPATAFANILYFTQWFMIIIVGGLSWIILFLAQKKINKNEHN